MKRLLVAVTVALAPLGVFAQAGATGPGVQRPALAKPFELQPEAAASDSTDQGASAVQRERLSILAQERLKTARELAELVKRPVGPEGPDEHAAQIARLQADLRALESEIVRVGREKPVATRVNESSARTARQPAGAQAAGKPSAPAEGDGVAYEEWDVFKNFGQQGNSK